MSADTCGVRNHAKKCAHLTTPLPSLPLAFTLACTLACTLPCTLACTLAFNLAFCCMQVDRDSCLAHSRRQSCAKYWNLGADSQTFSYHMIIGPCHLTQGTPQTYRTKYRSPAALPVSMLKGMPPYLLVGGARRKQHTSGNNHN